MRELLKQVEGRRLRFTGQVQGFTTQDFENRPKQRLVILVDVRLADTGDVLTDHMWITEGFRLTALRLRHGDRISFVAKVVRYWKGYLNVAKRIDEREMDFKLALPICYQVERRESTQHHEATNQRTECPLPRAAHPAQVR